MLAACILLAQTALEPAGLAAGRILDLFRWMAVGGAIIWLAFVGLAIYTLRARAESRNHGQANLLIILGGAIIPTVVLGLLLAYGLALLPDMLAPPPDGALKIAVSGEQWWWRVHYQPADGPTVYLANEIRLPVGEPVEFQLTSPDVIHSFWIPSLGGKVDMIPGRMNRLSLHPTRIGIFRGVCAEYCGTAHALMAFQVVVVSKEDFEQWLARQSQPAPAPVEAVSIRGRELFLANGCGACHTVRGTSADGVIGPDLTHVGGRLSLGAGILPNEPDRFIRWIAHTREEKPGVHMPPFGMLPGQDLQALASYLNGLE